MLQRLLAGGAPHPVGTEANGRVRASVLAELARLGYTPSLQKAFVCGRSGACATVTNVLARRAGPANGRAVLLCAHYDSVGAGPGASDDGMGVAALLEIARIVQGEPPPRNPIVFLIDDGEEAGLLGAEAFASEHPWAREIGAVVNLENRGTSGTSFLFETSEENRWLVDLAARSIAHPATSSLFYEIYKQLPNDTDLTVFREHGMAGVNFAAIGGVESYHTPRDDFEHASLRTLQHHGDNALAMVRALAGRDLAAPHHGNAVFFDLFGSSVVRWPEKATPAIAGATFLTLVAGIFLRRRAGRLSTQTLVWGLIGALVMPLLAAAAGLGASRCLRAIGALAAPWIAHPGWFLCTEWALGLFFAGLVAATLSRRAGPEGLWSGVWTWYAVCALVLAFAAPGVSFLFLIAAAGAGLLGLTSFFVHRPIARGAAAVAPACLAAFFWLPLAWLLYTAIGSARAWVIAAAAGFWAATVAPTFVSLPARGRRVILAALAAVAVIALAGAVQARPFSPDVPEQMPIVWQEDADTGHARWLLFPESGRLSRATREAAGCAKEPVPAYPWSGSSRAFAAQAFEQRLPSPEFLVGQDSRSASGRMIRATLRSPRGAPIVFLALPPWAAGARVVVGGVPVAVTAARWLASTGGWRVISCLTTPAPGIEVEIVSAGDRPLELWVGDRSRGLPPGGQRLIGARGPAAVPSYAGDETVVTRRTSLPLARDLAAQPTAQAPSEAGATR